MAALSDSVNLLLDFLQLRPGLLPVALIILGIFLIAGAYVVYTDVTKQIIPNWFNYSLILTGLVANPILFKHWPSHYVTAAATLIIFIALAEIARGGIGYGDVKLYTGLALYYGPAIILIILITSLVALIAGIVIACIKKRNWRKIPVPMAPFIFFSVIIVTAISTI